MLGPRAQVSPLRVGWERGGVTKAQRQSGDLPVKEEAGSSAQGSYSWLRPPAVGIAISTRRLFRGELNLTRKAIILHHLCWESDQSRVLQGPLTR